MNPTAKCLTNSIGEFFFFSLSLTLNIDNNNDINNYTDDNDNNDNDDNDNNNNINTSNLIIPQGITSRTPDLTWRKDATLPASLP